MRKIMGNYWLDLSERTETPMTVHHTVKAPALNVQTIRLPNFLGFETPHFVVDFLKRQQLMGSVFRLLQEGANFTVIQCECLRKAVRKKKHDEVGRYAELFVKGAHAKFKDDPDGLAEALPKWFRAKELLQPE
jgi:hypothetical protein